MSKTAAVLFTALALSGVAAANLCPSSPRYRIGLQLYTVRDDCAKDFQGTLRAVAKLGFSGVEFAGFYGRSAQEVRRWLDEDHLKCYGSHTNLDDLADNKFDKTVEYNKVLGNRLIVVPWIPPERRNSRAALLDTCKLFNDLAKRLKSRGMLFAYHDHADDFKRVDGDHVWDILFDNTDPDVLVQFDTGNALSAGQQAAPFLARYPGRVVSVHVKDYSATNPNALLGEGDEHWADVLKLWKARNGPHWFIIEQESYPFPSIVCAQKCLQAFQQMLEK